MNFFQFSSVAKFFLISLLFCFFTDVFSAVQRSSEEVAVREKGKKFLVLDLDNTLLFSNDKIIEGGSLMVKFILNQSVMYTWERPHLEEFMTFAHENFNLIVYTASRDNYAKSIVTYFNIFLGVTVEKVYTRKNIEKSFMKCGLKQISLLNELNDNYIIVDDRACYADDSKEIIFSNLLQIKGWNGENDDEELKKSIEYLKDWLESDLGGSEFLDKKFRHTRFDIAD